MTVHFADSALTKARELIALELWNQNAVAVNIEQPYRLASGNFSPIYIDCRRLLRSVAFADFFAGIAKLICERHDVGFDLIGGGETAGIPLAAFLARSMNVPMIYVRKSSKAHGTASRIEGRLGPGERVLLIEDLITDGASKLDFIDAIRDAGGKVADVLVVLDRLQGGVEALSGIDIHLHAATDISIVLDEGMAAGVHTPDVFAIIRDYLSNAEAWHASMSLPFQRKG
jgi:orotate phosphoribosyltransferase